MTATPAAEPAEAKPPATKTAGFDKGAFYRLCRMLHAYFSAFAFLALIFFSATGLLIDHPDWIPGHAKAVETRLVLAPAVLAEAAHAPDPNAALAAAVGRRTPLIGAYRSGEVDDGQANLRLEGVKGASTLVVDLKTGQTEASVERANALSVIGDLHRGKNASVPWRMVIDLSAILILVLSVIGYVLFFSLRFRLRTSLILTAASLAVMVAIFAFLTP